MTDTERMKLQERLDLAKLKMEGATLEKYLAADDICEGPEVPPGYKKCHKCGAIKKILLFNKDKSAKDGCTAQCKDCQKKNAQKSYGSNRHKRAWRKYYQEHKEERREKSRQYYQDHKEQMAVKHAAYRGTKQGKKAMERAHAKRAKALEEHAGIPYTREMVIDRDKQGGTEPICYLCGKPITGTPHLDHVIPVVMGGQDCFTNLACTHDVCNLMKSKDAREITSEQVETIIKLSEEYMDNHQDLFPEIFSAHAEDASSEAES